MANSRRRRRKASPFRRAPVTTLRPGVLDAKLGPFALFLLRSNVATRQRFGRLHAKKASVAERRIQRSIRLEAIACFEPSRPCDGDAAEPQSALTRARENQSPCSPIHVPIVCSRPPLTKRPHAMFVNRAQGKGQSKPRCGRSRQFKVRSVAVETRSSGIVNANRRLDGCFRPRQAVSIVPRLSFPRRAVRPTDVVSDDLNEQSGAGRYGVASPASNAGGDRLATHPYQK